MSIQTLYTAATGMEALESKLDVIANNLANVSTTAFKKDRQNFEDLLYRNETYPGVSQSGTPTGIGTHTGLGTRVASTQMNFEQGAIQQTGRELDIAIEGNGFLKVIDSNGNPFYTRAGNLSINSQGQLVLGSANVGRLVEPAIQIPENAQNLTITETGEITVIESGSTQANVVGQLLLTTFLNPEGLVKKGDNLYQQTDASGPAQDGQVAGQNGIGRVLQGVLEASNVEPVRELIDLIQTQRNFELNSQTVQAGDEVMQLISNLRR